MNLDIQNLKIYSSTVLKKSQNQKLILIFLIIETNNDFLMIFKNTIYLLNKVVKYIHQIFLYNCSFINFIKIKINDANIVVYLSEYLNHI